MSWLVPLISWTRIVLRCEYLWNPKRHCTPRAIASISLTLILPVVLERLNTGSAKVAVNIKAREDSADNVVVTTTLKMVLTTIPTSASEYECERVFKASILVDRRQAGAFSCTLLCRCHPGSSPRAMPILSHSWTLPRHCFMPMAHTAPSNAERGPVYQSSQRLPLHQSLPPRCTLSAQRLNSSCLMRGQQAAPL